MPDAIIFADQSFAVKNSGVSCLTSIFDLTNPIMKIQHAKIHSSWPDLTIYIALFSTH